MTNEPLFKSTHNAMLFAFNFSAQQYDRPAMTRMIKDTARRQGKGLAGLDGAGQAGMLLAEVGKLGAVEAAAIRAHYTRHTEPCTCGHTCCSGTRISREFAEACDYIAATMRPVMKERDNLPMLWRSLVAKHFGYPWRVRELAKMFRVSENTVAAHFGVIREHLTKLQDRAMNTLDAELKAGGVVEGERGN